MLKKQFLGAVAAASVFGLVASPAMAIPDSPPKGKAHGYWAQRLCDHIGSTTNGMTYWEDRDYEDRDACVDAEAASLARGEWDPADWPEI